MDRAEAMGFSGQTSYYIQREMVGSESGLQFQPNIGNNSIESTLLVEPTSRIPSNVGTPAGVGSTETIRRKRGRPRKYGSDGSVSLALSPSSSTPLVKLATTPKRGRGRPPGTGQKQRLASFGGWLSDTAGTGFTPHVITIAVGEDIAIKIMSVSQQGPRAICILAASGSISTVTLRQPSSGGTVTYEGHFEILCLSGSYLLANNGGASNRSGGLSISLASPDGRVIGGGVGGMLIAASPVQVIVGSFLCGNPKAMNKAGGSQGSASGVDDQTVENAATHQVSVQPTHILSPTSSMAVWPGSHSVAMQNPHADIDLMRGL